MLWCGCDSRNNPCGCNTDAAPQTFLQFVRVPPVPILPSEFVGCPENFSVWIWSMNAEKLLVNGLTPYVPHTHIEEMLTITAR